VHWSASAGLPRRRQSPFLHAAAQGLALDGFLLYTDNETWAGQQHPVEALRVYRRQRAAKLVNIAFTATGYSVGDPDDAGTLNVVGFDDAVPQLAADFVRPGWSR